MRTDALANKLAIFDLDGVLVALKDAHFHALNLALNECGYQSISREDHLSKFDGMPTKKKLEALGLFGVVAANIDAVKQKKTLAVLPEHVKPDREIAEAVHACHAAGRLVAVVSNARYETVRQALELAQVSYLVHWIHTPDSTSLKPKPSPEMFAFAMKTANACPKTTTVFEDSPHGLRAAFMAGCQVVQLDKLVDPVIVSKALSAEPEILRYEWPELNVLIPAAGFGNRFKEAGYKELKPFIPINGKPMLRRVIENLGVNPRATAIVLRQNTLPEDCWNYDNLHIHTLTEPTRGTAETCLEVSNFFDSEKPLLIANSDQIVEWDHLAFYYWAQQSSLDAISVVFRDKEKNPKWSFCDVGDDGLVKRMAEKNPISDIANCGLYWFRNGSVVVKYLKRVVDEDIRVKNEMYLSSIFPLMIEDGKKVGVFFVDKMHGLGVPSDLEAYLARNKRT